MASPVLETYCCMFTDTKKNFTALHSSYKRENLIAYNVFSIISSVLSICGATYQLFPKKLASHIRTEREIKSVLRQNYIISWLTLADLAATIGVLIRSSYWLNNEVVYHVPQDYNNNTEIHIVCIITSTWIQFFYIATYFWTFIFALDTYFLTVKRKSYRRCYHLLSWGAATLLCAVGLSALYAPDLMECRKVVKQIPHYISSLLPLVMTMIANPILYSKTSKAVQTLMYGRGSFTDRERQILRSLKIRFRAFMIAFTVCWFPTIVNVLLLPISRYSKRNGVFMAILCITSILNPLQGFLNSLLYRGVGLCPHRFLRDRDMDQPVTTNDADSSTRLLDSTESTTSQPTWYH